MPAIAPPLFFLNGLPALFVDFEATSLPPGSYPIEVGWALRHDAPPSSTLIRPAAEWTDLIWDPVAAEIHGIDQRQVQKDGRPAFLVAKEIAAIFARHSVISDAPDANGAWLDQLLDLIADAPKAIIYDARRVADALASALGTTAATARFIWREVEQSNPAEHRAGPDAARLAAIFAGIAERSRQQPVGDHQTIAAEPIYVRM
jgi:hypothetical protein